MAVVILLDSGEVVDYETFKVRGPMVEVDLTLMLRAVLGRPTPRRVYRGCRASVVRRRAVNAIKLIPKELDLEDALVAEEVRGDIVDVIERELIACRRSRPSRHERRAAEHCRHGRQRCEPNESTRHRAGASQSPPGQLVTSQPICALAPPPPRVALLVSSDVAVGIAA
jgi:hypothetical protein